MTSSGRFREAAFLSMTEDVFANGEIEMVVLNPVAECDRYGQFEIKFRIRVWRDNTEIELHEAYYRTVALAAGMLEIAQEWAAGNIDWPVEP